MNFNFIYFWDGFKRLFWWSSFGGWDFWDAFGDEFVLLVDWFWFFVFEKIGGESWIDLEQIVSKKFLKFLKDFLNGKIFWKSTIILKDSGRQLLQKFFRWYILVPGDGMLNGKNTSKNSQGIYMDGFRNHSYDGGNSFL